MTDIFVSYASEDKHRVKPLVDTFEAQGFSVWWDDHLTVGPRFDEKIEEVLESAGCVVVVWSAHSIGKHWVRAEANEGLERDVLVPLLIDDVRPPLVFRTSQTARLLGWPEQKGEISGVLLAISDILGREEILHKHTEQQRASLAVLPFTNLTPDPDQEYFADGITEDLIDLLSRHADLRVIARTSSFHFKDRTDDVRNIALELGVTHLVVGSVRRAGSKIRVSAQLIRASDGAHEWSDRFDRELHDVFAVQDEIAGEVARQLTILLLPQRENYHPSPEAYDQFLKGQAWLRRISYKGCTNARPFFERALKLDAGYADAHAAMAKAFMNERLFSYNQALDPLRFAADHVEKALFLDSRHVPALLQKAVITAQRDCDIQSGILLLHQARDLDPDGFETLDATATLYDYAGRPDLVEQTARQIIRIDPISIAGYLLLQVAQTSQGKYLEAQETISKLLELEPTHALTLANQAELLAQQGEVDSALDLIERHGLQNNGQACFVYAAAGMSEQIEKTVASLTSRSGFKVFLTHAYALLGNEEGVLASLRQAIDNRDPSLSHLTGRGIYHNCINIYGEKLATIYDGDAVQKLLRRVRFDQESLAKLHF